MAEPESSLQLLLLIPFAFVMGFLAAIPVGAVQLEIARRTLHGLHASAMMVIAGSVTSDVMYGVIALFGIAPFLRDRLTLGIFWSVNAAILVLIGFWALRTSRVATPPDDPSRRLLGKHHVAFLTGFSLSVTNPAMIFWWLIGTRFLQEVGIISHWTHLESIVFLLAGALGIASYNVLLAFGIHRAKLLLTPHVIQRITRGLAIVLLGLAAYAVVRAVMLLT